MSKPPRWLIAWLIALSIFTALAFSPPLFAKGEQAKLNALSNDISQLQKKLRVTRTKHDKSAAHLREIELKTAETRRRVLGLDKDIRLLGKELSKLYAQKEQLDGQRRRQAGQVAQELSAAYRLGREEPLKVLLNMENPEEDDVEQTLLSKQNILSNKRTELQAIHQTLKVEIKQRNALLKNSRKQINNEKSQITKLNLERQQLESIIQALQVHVQNLNIPDSQPFSQRRGKLPWPVKGRVGHSF